MKSPSAVTIVTQSEKLRAVLGRIGPIAASDSSVLLIGETGVGKELFADFIHQLSPRAGKPLVKIALSAMPHDLLESELFGHERGSFTHAVAEKRGLFELAQHGTLFLDDIDDVPPAIQPKLLRVLESREVLRVGGTHTFPIDVRLITASKVNLKELVERGIFRADLFYRIHVVPIHIPALRERREDVPLLAEHFLRRFASDKGLRFSAAALRVLVNHDWPGNVRELRNVVQQVALFASGEIQPEELPAELRIDHPLETLIKRCSQCVIDKTMSFNEVVSCLETNLLCQALRESGGNRSQAAKILGMNLSTLRDKLKKYGLDNPGTESVAESREFPSQA